MKREFYGPKKNKACNTKSQDEINSPYDRGFKLIFSHAVMIEALLKGFVPEEWVNDLDFTSLHAQGSEFDSLRRSMIQYMAKALKLHEVCPGQPITNLQEVNTMLAENIERWKKNWKQEGLQEGRQEGRQEGLRKNKEDYLLRLLKAKSVTITEHTLVQIKNATIEELDQWFDKLLCNETIECLEL